MCRGVLIAAALYALFFFRLGSYPLLDPDEPVYAQVASEMSAGGDWLTPHYIGEPWFDKPPLFYWLSAASTKAFGSNELACRLPSALLAVGLVFLPDGLASHDFSRRAGILAAVIMATCIQQIVLARATVTDMTLAFCTTAALYGYRRWLDADGKSAFGWAVLCGAMAGVGMLAKGPVAPLLLLVTCVLHLWRCDRLRRLTSSTALAGILSFLVVGVPWYAAMLSLHGEAFTRAFLLANNVNRFLQPEHVSQTGPWWSCLMNIPVLWAFFFPWSPFLPSALMLKRRYNDGSRLMATWIAVVFVFFSLSKTQLPTYIFPLYPAAAVLVGALMCSVGSDKRASRHAEVSLWAGLGTSILLGIAFVGGARNKFPDAVPAVAVLGGILVAAVVLAMIWQYRRRRIEGAVIVWTVGAGMVCFVVWLMAVIGPLAGPVASTRDLVRAVPVVDNAIYIEFNLRKPSLVYYLGRRPEHVYEDSAVRSMMMSHKPVFVFCKREEARLVAVPGGGKVGDSGDLVVVANRTGVQLKQEQHRD